MTIPIYIYETRNLDYLNSYIQKLNTLKTFTPIILTEKNLLGNKLFETFKDLYKHYSVNSENFEINCFARYFAISSLHNDSKNIFILSDSDIFISKRMEYIMESNQFNNIFVGSEGFLSTGSEHQISPHFSIWNSALINDFVNFVMQVYKKNQESEFLSELYKKQIEILGSATGISDMTLLYMWVNENQIPYLNSNSCKNDLGIDHNISSLYFESGVFNSFLGRKNIFTTKDEIFCVSNTDQIHPMSILHFQGRYKKILHDYYSKKYIKFKLYSSYIYFGRKVRNYFNIIFR